MGTHLDAPRHFVTKGKTIDQIPIESDGAMINLEVYARARRLNARIKELKVMHRPRSLGEQSGSNPRVVLRAFKELAKLFRDLR